MHPPLWRLIGVVVVGLLCDRVAEAQVPGGDNIVGQRGLLRSLSAENQPAGMFGLGMDLQYFKANGFLTETQEHSRLVNSYSLTFTPWRFLEAAVALHVISDNSVDGDNEELQVAVGDPQFSLKGSYSINESFSVGGLFDLRFPSGSGFFEPAGSAANVTLAGLASYTGTRSVPLNVHLNLGFAIDGSENLFDDPSRLSSAQLYAAHVSSFHRVVTRVGLSYVTRYIGPFLELSLEPFVGSGAPGFGDSPGLLSLGAQVWPTSSKGLQLLAAIDIGLTGVGDGEGAQLDAGKYAYVVPRWNLLFRLSYRFDPFAADKARLATEEGIAPPVEAPPSPRGSITGAVIDARTNKPVWNARVRVKGDTASELAVDPRDGRFRTYDLPTGQQTVTATADGYNPASATVEVPADGTASATLRLLPRTSVAPGTLRGTVKAVAGGDVKRATVLIPDLDQTIEIGSDGQFEISLKPGVYKIVVSAPGFRAQRKEMRIIEGSTVILNVELHPR